MFETVFVIAGAIIALSFVMVVIGMIRQARLSGRVFQHIEHELDRRARELSSNPPAEEQAAPPVTPRTCAYCGSALDESDECPACGARVS